MSRWWCGKGCRANAMQSYLKMIIHINIHSWYGKLVISKSDVMSDDDQWWWWRFWVELSVHSAPWFCTRHKYNILFMTGIDISQTPEEVGLFCLKSFSPFDYSWWVTWNVIAGVTFDLSFQTHTAKDESGVFFKKLGLGISKVESEFASLLVYPYQFKCVVLL